MIQYACFWEAIIKDIEATDSVGNADMCLVNSFAYGKKKLLEIGTRYGRSTVNIAKFAAADGHVYSIDTDQKQHEKYNKVIAPYKHKITFIEADSVIMDWDKYPELNGFNFVFIDGGHDFGMVASDTKNALARVKDDGVILWHDYVDSNEHDPDDMLLGRPGQVCKVIKALGLPAIPVGGYLALLEMQKIRGGEWM